MQFEKDAVSSCILLAKKLAQAGSSLRKLAQESFIGLRFRREPLFSTHFLEKTPLSHKGGSPLKFRCESSGLLRRPFIKNVGAAAYLEARVS